MEKNVKEDLPVLIFALFLILTMVPFLDLFLIPLLFVLRKNTKVDFLIWFKVSIYALTALLLFYQYKIGVFPG